MRRQQIRHSKRIGRRGESCLNYETLEGRKLLAAVVELSVDQIDVTPASWTYHLDYTVDVRSYTQLEPVLEDAEPLGNDVEFKLIESERTPYAGGDEVQIWRDFTIDGAVEESVGLVLPKQISEAIASPDSKTIYGISSHELYEFNLETGESKLLRFNGKFSRPSWLSGITLDTTRNRIVVSAKGSSGFDALYDFDIEAQQWGELEWNNQETWSVGAITYDADSDLIWSVNNFGGVSLRAHDHTGEVVRSVGFGGQVPSAFEPFYGGEQLIYKDGNLVYMSTFWGSHDPADLRPAEQAIYLLQPNSKTATEVSRISLPLAGSSDNVVTPFPELLPVHVPTVNEEIELSSFFRDVDEVHLASYYDNSTSGDATLTIDRPGKTVGLVLLGYDNIRWNIKVTEGTRVEAVLLGGHHKQTLSGLEDDVRIVDASFEDSELPDRELFTLVASDINSIEFRKLISTLNNSANVSISSAHAGYSWQQPIMIDSVSDDARLGAGFQDAVDPELLPERTFMGVEFVDTLNEDGVFDRVPYLIEYSLLGPQEDSERTALPTYMGYTSFGDGIKRYASSPLGSDYALIPGSDTLIMSNLASIFSVDLLTGDYTKLSLPQQLSRNDDITAVAYDSTGERLIVSFDNWMGDGTLIMEHSLETGQWQTIGRFGLTMNIQSITFDADSGMIWALATSGFAGTGTDRLVSIDRNGELVDSIDFADRVMPDLMPYGDDTHKPQLFAQNGQIVYLSSPATPREVEQGRGYADSFMYLIDPTANSIELAWRTNNSNELPEDQGVEELPSGPVGDAPGELPGESDFPVVETPDIQDQLIDIEFSEVDDERKVCMHPGLMQLMEQSADFSDPSSLPDFADALLPLEPAENLGLHEESTVVTTPSVSPELVGLALYDLEEVAEPDADVFSVTPYDNEGTAGQEHRTGYLRGGLLLGIIDQSADN